MLLTGQTQPRLLGHASQNKTCVSAGLGLTCALGADELLASSCPSYSPAILLEEKLDQGVTEALKG